MPPAKPGQFVVQILSLSVRPGCSTASRVFYTVCVSVCGVLLFEMVVLLLGPP